MDKTDRIAGDSAVASDHALRQRFLLGMSHAACTVNVVTTDVTAGRHSRNLSPMASEFAAHCGSFFGVAHPRPDA